MAYIAPHDTITWLWDDPEVHTPGTNVLSVSQYRDPLLTNNDPFALFGSSGEANQLFGVFSVNFSYDITANLPSGRQQSNTYPSTVLVLSLIHI